MPFFTPTEPERRKKAMEAIKQSYEREVRVLDNLEKDELQRKEFAGFERFFSWQSFSSIRKKIGDIARSIEHDAEIVWRLYGQREVHTKQEALLWNEILIEMGKINARMNEITPNARDNWPVISTDPRFKDNLVRIRGLLMQIQKELAYEIKFSVDNIQLDRTVAQRMVNDFRDALSLTSPSRK